MAGEVARRTCEQPPPRTHFTRQTSTAAPVRSETVRITVLAGGVGGARFLRGLREWAGGEHELTAVVNVGDDMWLSGVRIAPDLDSVMYTLAGQNDEQRGWGRVGESERVAGELRAYGVGWPWFTLGDLDLGTHLARTSMLRDGLTLSEATARITSRWDLGVRLLPATDEPFETQVTVEDGRVMHFQEWWTRYRADLPAVSFDRSGPVAAAPGVLEAISDADVVLFAPSNPVVSITPVLDVGGVREAVRTASAPVVGVSPIIAGNAVRGMADACLRAVGVETTADAVARWYGARSAGGVLDGWLVDTSDADRVADIVAAGIAAEAVPLWMRDPATSAALAADAVRLARSR